MRFLVSWRRQATLYLLKQYQRGGSRSSEAAKKAPAAANWATGWKGIVVAEMEHTDVLAMS